MQIIKLWFKLTAILALLGWGMHTFSPGFAAWTDGFFKGKDVIDAQMAKHPQDRPARATLKQADAKPAMTSHKLNE